MANSYFEVNRDKMINTLYDEGLISLSLYEQLVKDIKKEVRKKSRRI